jgi:hypothetical protein
MLVAAIVLLGLAVVLGLIVGARYLTATEFMPYQAAVLGKSWPELEPRLQAVILAMLRVGGGGFIGLALAVAWLSFALLEGVRWAPWATLTIAVVMLAPALYSTLALRKVEATAHTPVAPTVAAIALIAAGAILALLASVF